MTYKKEFFLSLYRMMVMIRACEESFVEPIRSGEIRCPVHLYSGQEAIAAGVSANLHHTDKVFGTHRSHGHFLAKGGDLRKLVAEVYCKEGGCSVGRGGSMHLIDPESGFLGSAPIVAGTISLALGAALADRIRGGNTVTVAYFGDGAAGEGVLYEAMNFASLHKLPLLFVCENNFYATHMPIQETRSRKSIFESAEPFDIRSERVDGNDVLAVYEAARRAVTDCREGQGPVFLEFTTYRLRGHVGPDDNIQGDHTDIRPHREVEEWKKKDPIPVFRDYLIHDKMVSKDELDTIDKSVSVEVSKAHDLALGTGNPDPRELAKYVFSKPVS
ncbi:MAG: thiamine pyrophosphate-dependent dehydrogenase E1 component subunit alpha [Deltaproteobacteria bacterium]|nr:thiamine pyrophosphate-dependent dehydrogenase E1 component subunit alpha [Deltaproteobacteria bacterium]